MQQSLTTNEVEASVKSALEQCKIMQLFSSWQRHGDDWKLVYSIYGMTLDELFCIHTRLVFLFNKEKTQLAENAFLILINYNCEYQPVDIGKDLSININNAIKSVCEGGSIKDLSDFLMSGTDGFNKEIKEQGIDNFIIDLKFEPNEKAINCFEQVFTFIATDKLEEWQFTLLIDTKKKQWHCSVNGSEFDVLDLKVDVYKQIIANKY